MIRHSTFQALNIVYIVILRQPCKTCIRVTSHNFEFDKKIFCKNSLEPKGGYGRSTWLWWWSVRRTFEKLRGAGFCTQVWWQAILVVAKVRFELGGRLVNLETGCYHEKFTPTTSWIRKEKFHGADVEERCMNFALMRYPSNHDFKTRVGSL